MQRVQFSQVDARAFDDLPIRDHLVANSKTHWHRMQLYSHGMRSHTRAGQRQQMDGMNDRNHCDTRDAHVSQSSNGFLCHHQPTQHYYPIFVVWGFSVLPLCCLLSLYLTWCCSTETGLTRIARRASYPSNGKLLLLKWQSVEDANSQGLKCFARTPNMLRAESKTKPKMNNKNIISSLSALQNDFCTF